MKNWTILIYIAGDNDLYRFAIRNIQQLLQIGSNNLVNIVIHFDFHQNKKPKETRRFYVEKNRLIQVGEHKAMDSGSAETLINASEWAIKNYPSKHFGLVFWNHGSGDLNPTKMKQLINPSELFYYNTQTRMIELDRNIEFMQFLSDRGVCFDGTTGNYLNDEKMVHALSTIKKLRGGKKIDIILFDACLMAGIGTASLIAPYASYMTASEEVVLGPGYNYAATIKPLATQKNITAEHLATHIVKSYAETYSPVTQDYTQSAINLSHISNLSNLLSELSNTITSFMNHDQQGIIKRKIKLSGSKRLCTHFDEPNYIDLWHFLKNILHHCSEIKVTDNSGNDFYIKIKDIINAIFNLKNKVILSSVYGKNFTCAEGIYVYFPDGKIHPSFSKTSFGRQHKWTNLLHHIS